MHDRYVNHKVLEQVDVIISSLSEGTLKKHLELLSSKLHVQAYHLFLSARASFQRDPEAIEKINERIAALLERVNELAAQQLILKDSRKCEAE